MVSVWGVSGGSHTCVQKVKRSLDTGWASIRIENSRVLIHSLQYVERVIGIGLITQ